MKTLSQYYKLLGDRPTKWSAEEVGFSSKAKSATQSCGKCWHWFQGVNQGRTTCEIYTGIGYDRNVPEEATCGFWTKDGVNFPRLPKTQQPPE